MDVNLKILSLVKTSNKGHLVAGFSFYGESFPLLFKDFGPSSKLFKADKSCFIKLKNFKFNKSKISFSYDSASLIFNPKEESLTDFVPLLAKAFDSSPSSIYYQVTLAKALSKERDWKFLFKSLNTLEVSSGFREFALKHPNFTKIYALLSPFTKSKTNIKIFSSTKELSKSILLGGSDFQRFFNKKLIKFKNESNG